LATSIDITHVDVEADLASKERALKKLAPAGAKVHRFNRTDELMAFLNNLIIDPDYAQ
jgi:hypothetical protein